jgi:hypothetical protein
MGQGTVHVRIYCGNPAIRASKAHPVTYLPSETRDPCAQGTLHVQSYCGNPAIQAGKTHAFPYFTRKLRDEGRQGTLMYVVTVENWRVYVSVYYNFVLVPAVTMKTRMCMHV